MRFVSALLVVLLMSRPAMTAEISPLLQRIKAVGKEGAGNPDAAAACADLCRQPVECLPDILSAMNDCSPTAANWLRSAIESIVAREQSAGRPIPKRPLEAFLHDERNNGRSRRFAFELIYSANPTARDQVLSTMINDPSAELRFEAIAAALDTAQKSPVESSGAKTALRKLLSAARDGTQIEDIAKELGRRGERIDLRDHFGFITRWQIAGPFDNRGGAGFAAAFAPERSVDLSAIYQGKNGAQVTWLPHVTTDQAGIIDLNAIYPDPGGARDRKGKLKGLKAAVAYAFAEVDSPTEQSIEVRAASSPALKVFVNGQNVLARESYHQSFDRDSHLGPARLKKGRNTILVKVCQNDQPEEWAQNWMFQLRLTDELGAKARFKIVTPGFAESPP